MLSLKCKVGGGNTYNEVLDDLVVVKRSGQRVQFNASKVALAIKKTFDIKDDYDENAVYIVFEKVLAFINDNYKDRKTINVEDVQDIVENVLFEENHYEVYEAFKSYRKKRALSRKVFIEKSQHKFVKAIEKIESLNLNKDNSKGAEDLIFDFGKIISSEYAKSYMLDTKSLRYSEEGNIFIHDLNYLSLGIIPYLHLEFNEKINTDEDLNNFIISILNPQKEVYNEIGINNLNLLLSEYLLKFYKEDIRKNISSYLENLGISDYINERKFSELLQKEKDIIISKDMYKEIFSSEVLFTVFEKVVDKAYNNTILKSSTVIRNVLTSIEKMATRHLKYSISFGIEEKIIDKIINETITKEIYENSYKKIKFIKKINEITKKDLEDIKKCLAKNKELYLSFSPLEYFTNGIRIYENINNDVSRSTGRMVISSTSINLGRLGLKYKNKNIKEFYDELDFISDLVKNQLLSEFEMIGNRTYDYYKTIFKGNVFDDEKLESGQKIRKVIKNGILNIGLIGLKECAMCLSNNKDEEEKLIIKILDFLNSKCSKYSSENKVNFALYEPINKSARKELLAIDKAIYGVVKGVTDKDMYDLLDYSSYKTFKNILDKFSGGKLVSVNFDKEPSKDLLEKKISEIKLKKVEFAKFAIEDDN